MRRPVTTATPATHRAPGRMCLAEMQEFAGFPKSAQRYIRRSLDVGLGRRDAVKRWARSPAEAAAIRAQAGVYQRLERVRACAADDFDLETVEALLTPLVALLAFDLGEGKLACFASCRFLYERLAGAAIRPWLPAAFCAAAALPTLHPDRRLALLQSLSETAITAPGWSTRPPVFLPEWVEKVDPAITC